MGVNHGADIRPCPINLAVDIALQVLIPALAGYRLAIEIVFDYPVRRDHARRDPARKIVVIGVGRTAHADVAGCIENTHFWRGQNAIGHDQIVNQPFFRRRS